MQSPHGHTTVLSLAQQVHPALIEQLFDPAFLKEITRLDELEDAIGFRKADKDIRIPREGYVYFSDTPSLREKGIMKIGGTGYDGGVRAKGLSTSGVEGRYSCRIEKKFDDWKLFERTIQTYFSSRRVYKEQELFFINENEGRYIFDQIDGTIPRSQAEEQHWNESLRAAGIRIQKYRQLELRKTIPTVGDRYDYVNISDAETHVASVYKEDGASKQDQLKNELTVFQRNVHPQQDPHLLHSRSYFIIQTTRNIPLSVISSATCADIIYYKPYEEGQLFLLKYCRRTRKLGTLDRLIDSLDNTLKHARNSSSTAFKSISETGAGKVLSFAGKTRHDDPLFREIFDLEKRGNGQYQTQTGVEVWVSEKTPRLDNGEDTDGQCKKRKRKIDDSSDERTLLMSQGSSPLNDAGYTNPIQTKKIPTNAEEIQIHTAERDKESTILRLANQALSNELLHWKVKAEKAKAKLVLLEATIALRNIEAEQRD